jgi:hypothetical protein
MLWCGLDCPFFFHGFVTGQAYHDMLSEYLVPQLQQACIKDAVVLQLDGARPHFALHVRDYLNETFPGRWTGRGSEASPAPFAWPPRSPDLTTPGTALSGDSSRRGSAKCGRHNRIVTGSCRRSLHSRDPGLSAQNICQNMEQNSTVLRQ